MQKNFFSLLLVSCAIIAGATGTTDTTYMSLDRIERLQLNASTAPTQLPATQMMPIRPSTVKKVNVPGSISLNGEWQLSDTKDFSSLVVDAKVPGSVHGAMYTAGKIPDPTIGINDTIAEKLSYRDWWYRKTFAYNENWSDVMLSFKGIANKCTVYLNGTELGKHEGMMGGPDYNVTKLLKKGTNELLVHIEPIPCIMGNTHNISWIQTVVANCVYGWHYVRCPSLGIWNDVTLTQIPSSTIADPYIITESVDGDMRLVVDLPHPVKNANLTLLVKPKNFDGAAQAYTSTINDTTGICAFNFKINDPQLWWPNGSGKQNLYTATITLKTPQSTIADSKTINFGIRTLDMRPVAGVEKPDTYNWKFVINNKPIFIKGTNWCLMDFMLDLSPERYNRFLGAAKEQNLNFLRAWGGGLVETDTFYDLCDEMGLMVMQEWPTGWNSHLHQNADVFRETIDRNTPRIRTHPSLVLWAGGNESNNPVGDLIDYMGRKSIEHDGTRPFHRGEPWGGSWHNHDTWWLDLHMNNALNMNSLFFGEFGMPSLPVKETIVKYLDGEQFKMPLDSNPVFVHHSPIFGTAQDMWRLNRIVSFTLEPTSLDNLILGSQIAQTLGTRRALERARTMWPDRSGGATYYKINDVYPGLSWGSVDYYGAKKLTHYFVKRSAQPLLPIILFNQTDMTGQDVALKYYIVDDNDTLANDTVTVTVNVYDRLLKPVYQRIDTVMPKEQVVCLPDICLTAQQVTSPLLYFKTDIIDTDGNVLARNWYIENFDSKQNAIFDSPKATLSTTQLGKVVTVTNMSDSIPAIAVTLEVNGEASTLDLSDNAIWLDPGEKISIKTNTDSPATISAWNIAP